MSQDNAQSLFDDLVVWRRLLDEGHPEAVVAYITTARSTSTQKVQHCVAQVLARRPISHELLDAVDDARMLDGIYPEDWIKRATRSGAGIDWRGVMTWREYRMGRKRARQEARAAWDWALEDYIQVRTLNGRDHITRLLVGLLDAFPVLARKAPKEQHGRALFELSCEPAGRNWLDASGVHLGQLLEQAVQHHNFPNFLVPEEDGRSAFDRWLEGGVRRQRAWARLQAQDRALAGCHEDWLRTWLEHGTWHGSALEAWCRGVESGKLTQANPHPGQHALFDGLGGELQKQEDRELATRYCEVLTDGPVPWLRAVRENEARRRWLGEQQAIKVAGFSDITLDAVAFGLARGMDWVDELARTAPGAQQIQTLLSHDFRVGLSLWAMDTRKITQWILEQPAWHTWQDRNGQNLLDVWIGAHRGMPPGAWAKMTKGSLLAMARKCPQLLTNPDLAGRPTLDRLNLDENVRSAVARVLLKHQAPSTRARAHKRGRM